MGSAETSLQHAVSISAVTSFSDAVAVQFQSSRDRKLGISEFTNDSIEHLEALS